MDSLKVFRVWFMAAAVYNLVWGVAVTLFPAPLLALVGISGLSHLPLVQVSGMMVAVYAIGYWLLAKDPVRYSGNVWVGLAGKTFGPIGFLFFAIKGQLPWQLGWTILTNDIVWWPASWTFALRHARHPLR